MVKTWSALPLNNIEELNMMLKYDTTKERLNGRVKLLDATLRDGGQGLDDLFNNGFSDKFHSEEAKHKVIDSLGNSGIELIELGAMDPSEDDKSKFAIYQNVEELSQYLPENKDPNKMYLGLYIGPDTDIDKGSFVIVSFIMCPVSVCIFDFLRKNDVRIL